jgi:hypothetical protein
VLRKDAVPYNRIIDYRKIIVIFCKSIRDVEEAVPYKKIIGYRKIILIFRKPIRDVGDAVPYKKIIHHRKRNPRPAGEGQGEGKSHKYENKSSVNLSCFFASQFGTSGTPSPTKKLSIIGKETLALWERVRVRGKWRRYENKSSVKLS